MGIAQLLKEYGPMIQMASAPNEESNFDLLQRLATSKIIKPSPPRQSQPGLPPSAPVDPGIDPRPNAERLPVNPDVQNPDVGFNPPAASFPQTPALGTASLDPALLTRSRRVTQPGPAVTSDPDLSFTSPAYGEPFGSSGEPFGSARPRRTQPRDYAADDAQYLRDLQMMPVERSRLKSAGLAAARGLVSGGPGAAIGAGLVGLTQPELYGEMKRGRETQRAERNLAGDLEYRKTASELAGAEANLEYRRAQTDYLRTKSDLDANKAEAQRCRDIATYYNRLPEFDPQDPVNAELVRAMTDAGLPVVLKSRGLQLRYVQDARTGAWTIIAGDRSTGEGTASSVTTPEGAPAVTTPPAQITAEWREADRESRERIATLSRQSRETIVDLNRRPIGTL